MSVVYDISPPITPDLKVWPGDTPPTREVLLDMKQGDNLTLSTLRATVHLGAHADAPSHYGVDAPSIEQWAPDRYWGPCQVIHVDVSPGERINDRMVGESVRAERVLFATGTFPDPTDFNEDFAGFAAEYIERLAGHGVKLVGIDTPSVDLFASQDLEAHRACLQHEVAILEGIVLRDVPPGHYELVALPLMLVGFDASPVRALLRDLG